MAVPERRSVPEGGKLVEKQSYLFPSECPRQIAGIGVAQPRIAVSSHPGDAEHLIKHFLRIIFVRIHFCRLVLMRLHLRGHALLQIGKVDDRCMYPLYPFDHRIRRRTDLRLVAHVQHKSQMVILPQLLQISLACVKEAGCAQQHAAPDLSSILQDNAAKLAGIVQLQRQRRRRQMCLQRFRGREIHLYHARCSFCFFLIVT